MKRSSLSALALAVILLGACSTARPAPKEPPVDPMTEATVIGAVDEAVLQGSIDGAEAAVTGRRIGRVAGVLAAVLGGPSHESLDDTIDRYRMTRDVTTAVAASIGATKGAIEGAKRGFELDTQFAELLQIEGIEAVRPYPDEIQIRVDNVPSAEVLRKIAAVFAERTQRTIDIKAAGGRAWDLRDALIDAGMPPSCINAHRDARITGIVLRIRYADDCD